MVKKWKKVDNKCFICGEEVGKIKIINGKIEIEEKYPNFGTFVQVKGRAEMKVLCKYCQKELDKKKIKYFEALQKSLKRA